MRQMKFFMICITNKKIIKTIIYRSDTPPKFRGSFKIKEPCDAFARFFVYSFKSQLIGVEPILVKYSFALENGLEPQKPLWQESGEGCALSIIK